MGKGLPMSDPEIWEEIDLPRVSPAPDSNMAMLRWLDAKRRATAREARFNRLTRAASYAVARHLLTGSGWWKNRFDSLISEASRLQRRWGFGRSGGASHVGSR